MAHVLLITGGGRGIGAATAKLAAGRGYDVGVTYKSDATSAADVVAAVKAKGRNAVAIAADMGREADVERMFKEADALGRLTHFVYNAGIPGKAGRLESAVDNSSEPACAAHTRRSHRPLRRPSSFPGANQGSAAATPKSNSATFGVTS